MKIFYSLVFLSFFIQVSNNLYGTSMSFLPSENIPPEYVLSTADGVLEVEVLNILFKNELSNGCLNYLYKVRIVHVYKGKFKRGDVITVGLGNQGFLIYPTQKQLVVVNSFNSNSICEYTQLNLKLNITENINFIFPSRLSIYEILKNQTKSKEFKVINCNRKKWTPLTSEPIFLFDEDSDLENKIRKYELHENNKILFCTEVVGKYLDLKKHILNGLKEENKKDIDWPWW